MPTIKSIRKVHITYSNKHKDNIILILPSIYQRYILNIINNLFTCLIKDTK